MIGTAEAVTARTPFPSVASPESVAMLLAMISILLS
jgi:hypothetical protein